MGLLDKIAKARAQNRARKEENDIIKAEKSVIRAKRNEEIAEAKTKASKAKLKLEEVEAQRAQIRAKKPKSGMALLLQNIGKASQEKPKRAAPRRKPAKKAKPSTSQYITVAGKRYKASPAKKKAKKSGGKTVTFRID